MGQGTEEGEQDRRPDVPAVPEDADDGRGSGDFEPRKTDGLRAAEKRRAEGRAVRTEGYLARSGG